MADNDYQYLVDEYNRLVDYRNDLVREYNYLAEELVDAINAAVSAINYAVDAHNVIMPRLNQSSVYVEEVASMIKEVRQEIAILSQKYFIVKNVSTASKNLTQLDMEYQRKFGLYNTLRRVTLGYVVGVDSNIISNEKLRNTVEKNYLQNADYWIAHCLMATMLWVSDEKEAATRAVEKAMDIDPHKSSLFFLLINLHFGRHDAASQWFEYYLNDVDVMNVGDEIRILLQAYLYNICGNDPEFKNKIKEAFENLLSSAKNNCYDYTSRVNARVFELINGTVRKTDERFEELERNALDYPQMIKSLENAEKNKDFALYFDELYSMDSDAPVDMLERIQNVLYDLVSTYDEAEMKIIREMDHNEMILEARGDLAAADLMFKSKYKTEKAQTMGELMVKLAFPSINDEVDVRVRKFSVSYLCDNIISAFEAFKKKYNNETPSVHQITVDTMTVSLDEAQPENALYSLKEQYIKNRNKFIMKDKGVKVLTALSWIFWIAWGACSGASIYLFANQKPWHPLLIGAFALTFIAAVGCTIGLVFQRRKAGAYVTMKMNAALEKLQKIISEVKQWREKFIKADSQSDALINVLKKFKNNEENA